MPIIAQESSLSFIIKLLLSAYLKSFDFRRVISYFMETYFKVDLQEVNSVLINLIEIFKP